MIARKPHTPLPFRHLSEVQTDATDQPFIALIPGELAPLHRLDLPAALRDRVRGQVARAQLESLLQRDLDDLDIRLGNAESADAALVTDAESAAGWRRALEPVASQVRALLPDYLSLPGRPGTWILKMDPDDSRLLARLGPEDGFSASLAPALLQLASTLRREGPPQCVELAGPVPADLERFLADAKLPVSREGAAGSVGPGPAELAFDLCRDPVAERAELASQIRAWRLPTAAMLLGLLTLCCALWLDSARATDEARALRAASTDLARTTFIPSGPILDLRLQVGREIARRQQLRSDDGQGDQGLEMLQTAAQTLNDLGIAVHRLQVDRSGSLLIEAKVADFSALDALIAALGRPGVATRLIDSSSESGQGVHARIALTPATLSTDQTGVRP
ncbi:hypothetical protein KUV28_18385 [Ferrimonas balearica]|nr:hypothetical protein [Ferrimonas balearica]